MQLHPTSGSNKVVCMYYEVGAKGVHCHMDNVLIYEVTQDKYNKHLAVILQRL